MVQVRNPSTQGLEAGGLRVQDPLLYPSYHTFSHLALPPSVGIKGVCQHAQLKLDICNGSCKA